MAQSHSQLVCIHAFEPEAHDELEMEPGDVIELVHPNRAPPGDEALWITGRNLSRKGTVGIFPINGYCRPLRAERLTSESADEMDRPADPLDGLPPQFDILPPTVEEGSGSTGAKLLPDDAVGHLEEWVGGMPDSRDCVEPAAAASESLPPYTVDDGAVAEALYEIERQEFIERNRGREQSAIEREEWAAAHIFNQLSAEQFPPAKSAATQQAAMEAELGAVLEQEAASQDLLANLKATEDSLRELSFQTIEVNAPEEETLLPPPPSEWATDSREDQGRSLQKKNSSRIVEHGKQKVIASSKKEVRPNVTATAQRKRRVQSTTVRSQGQGTVAVPARGNHGKVGRPARGTVGAKVTGSGRLNKPTPRQCTTTGGSTSKPRRAGRYPGQKDAPVKRPHPFLDKRHGKAAPTVHNLSDTE